MTFSCKTSKLSKSPLCAIAAYNGEREDRGDHSQGKNQEPNLTHDQQNYRGLKFIVRRRTVQIIIFHLLLEELSEESCKDLHHCIYQEAN